MSQTASSDNAAKQPESRIAQSLSAQTDTEDTHPKSYRQHVKRSRLFQPPSPHTATKNCSTGTKPPQKVVKKSSTDKNPRVSNNKMQQAKGMKRKTKQENSVTLPIIPQQDTPNAFNSQPNMVPINLSTMSAPSYHPSVKLEGKAAPQKLPDIPKEFEGFNDVVSPTRMSNRVTHRAYPKQLHFE